MTLGAILSRKRNYFLCTQHGSQHHLRRISMPLLQTAACDLLWTSSDETWRSVTLIMRAKEERRIKPGCTGPSLSTGAAPILFQREVTVTPTEGWRGWRAGWSDRRTGPFQRLSGLTMGCFCLAELCVCAWTGGILVTSWNRYPTHTYTRADPLSCSVLWPCADLSRYLVHLSTGDLLILLSTHHSLSKHIQSPPWLRNIKPSAKVSPCLHPM